MIGREKRAVQCPGGALTAGSVVVRSLDASCLLGVGVIELLVFVFVRVFMLVLVFVRLGCLKSHLGLVVKAEPARGHHLIAFLKIALTNAHRNLTFVSDIVLGHHHYLLPALIRVEQRRCRRHHCVLDCLRDDRDANRAAGL